MTNPNDPKVVPGGDVQFDSNSAPKADSLDGVVQQASGSAGSGSWERENMRLLGKVVQPIFGRTFGGYVINSQNELFDFRDRPIPDDLAELLGYVLRLTRPNPSLPTAQIDFCDVHPPHFRQFLEARHGPAIVRSGIYQATGLDKDEPVAVAQLFPYIPELEQLRPLAGRLVKLFQNPYQCIMTYPASVRAFFTGAVGRFAGEIDTSTEKQNFYWPVTLTDVLQYAEKVNQVEKVAEYMRLITGELPK